MRPRISVIVLNWNGKHLLERCLPSVLAQTYTNFETILVDNGSVDRSSDYVKNTFPNIRIIQLQKNLGFAAGNNKGIEAAKGDFVFILNNDTMLDPECLTYLMQSVEGKTRVGMVAPKMLLPDGDIDTYGIKLKASGLSSDIKTTRDKPLCPCGGAAFYRKKVLEEIKFGGDYFDSDFFIYYEDLDLGLRARSRLWKCASQPRAIVHHDHGATMKRSDKSIFLGTRNRIWTIRKNYPTAILIRYSIPIIALQAAIFFKYLLKGKAGVILNAWKAAYKKRFVIYEKRRKLLRKQRLSVREWRHLFA
ncbi:MAG: glycosyltransferase family 2 protein [Nanoarchaeota archaeon]